MFDISKILTKQIKNITELIFFDMNTCMKTCDRNYTICGTPVWRYFYHTLHSCDKWFINPFHFTEPDIHTINLDKVDLKTDTVLTDTQLYDYFCKVKSKTLNYLDNLTDEMLNEKPQDCKFTRLELILGQYRHFMCHIGILNGITIANKNKYPIVTGLNQLKINNYIGKLYDE